MWLADQANGRAAHAIDWVFMPSKPLPWDRKDFFKERKHERSESLSLL